MTHSKKTTAGMLLIVVLASSLVISNMIIFSAASIAKKADDVSIRIEVLGEEVGAIAQGKKSIPPVGDIFEYALVAPINSMINSIAHPLFLGPAANGATTIAASASDSIGEEETSWSPALADNSESQQPPLITNNNTGEKLVILTFDDGWKSQYEYAKPVLDKYGFKATFFIVCNYVEYPAYMGWRQIRDLHKDGHDIQSHSVTHRDLTRLSQEELDYELGQSKQCLRERGIDSTVFATPHNAGWNNATVIDAISRYYEFAKNGNHRIMYLHCDGWKEYSNQTDCKTYEDDDSEATKQLTFANRYSIRAWSHNYYGNLYQHNDTKVFEKFVETVNAPFVGHSLPDNNSVVVLEYHSIDDERTATSTSPRLFEAEMRYLSDNGFSVLTMSDFNYDENSNYLSLFVDSSRG